VLINPGRQVRSLKSKNGMSPDTLASPLAMRSNLPSLIMTSTSLRVSSLKPSIKVPHRIAMLPLSATNGVCVITGDGGDPSQAVRTRNSGKRRRGIDRFI